MRTPCTKNNTSSKESQYPVLADHMGNTGLRILASSFSNTLWGKDSQEIGVDS